MIAYAMFGTNDLAKATDFYDAVLGEIGVKRGRAIGDRGHMYPGSNGGMFILCKPYDGGPATVGNGSMISFAAPTREAAAAAHAKALALGGTDEGAPGERAPTFYGAYVRDLDGNKLCFCKMG